MTIAATLRLDIVSAEKEIFSGEVEMFFVTGEMGELGVTPGHSQLLTTLRPGHVRVILKNKEEEIFYISGGMLEVQPYIATVLADTALAAEDIDMAAAEAVKAHAENALAGKVSAMEIAKATTELAEAVAQIRVIQQFKKKANIK